MDDILHIAYDCFNVIVYIVSNIGTLFSLIFAPLAWLFNFLKGFFVGILAAPTTPAVSSAISNNVMAVFNAIPSFASIEQACAAGLAILVSVFIFRRLIEF